MANCPCICQKQQGAAQIHHLEGDNNFQADWVDDFAIQNMGNAESTGNSNSLHSLLRMNATVQDTHVSVLHDDGSTHDFISECLAHKLKLPTLKSSFKVKSAFWDTWYNGISMITDLPITMGAYTQKRSFLVVPLQSRDIMSITLILITIHTLCIFFLIVKTSHS